MADEISAYPYDPNIPAAAIAAGVFGLSAAIHTFMMIRKKTWFYLCLVIGAWMMTAGYCIRIPSAKNPGDIAPFVAQSLLIILPPSLYAATVYMIYGRITLFVQCPQASLIAPQKVTKIFVIGDLAAFLLQAGGGSMMAKPEFVDRGQKIILFGLVVQIIAFGLFLMVSLVFLKRMRNQVGNKSIPRGKHSWKGLFGILLGASTLIIGRCIFRIVEFSQGHDGKLVSNELYLYIFDCLPMALVQILFHIVHAGDVFNDSHTGFVRVDETMAVPLVAR